MAVDLTSGPEVGLLNLHFFYICRHHPTLKFKPHATDDERYVLGIDGVPLRCVMVKMYNHVFSLYCRVLFYPFKMCNGQNVCIFPVLYGQFNIFN